MPAVYDRCVEHVRGKKGVTNPYAVCRASMGSDAEIHARAKQKDGPIKKKLRHYRSSG